ncbi:CRM-domain containing factor CFM2, chloroplastic isoform X2 [Magnolia sinica]|uniref:CRM-domain containing factor CFM2, chloroplastic isoform X2 n=1 Tax=Magnolia sinica TaxID=86752 RepID=UPI00265A0BDA|nr:CRM-domain containing factor CFM2, chloroplastic isoform X2 [Magnolia sinica]
MLLAFYHHQPISTLFCSKTLQSLPSSAPSLCCYKNSSNPCKSIIPCHSSAAAGDTETVPKTAIQRIAEKLRSLGYLDDDTEHREMRNGSAGVIFLPPSHQLPKHRVGHTIDTSWSTPESPVPEPGSGPTITRFHEMMRRKELEKEKEKQKQRQKKKGRASVPPSVAELTIAEEELKRLRSVGIRLDKKLKVGKAGITEGILNGIHERWRRSELVKIKCDDLCRMNMKRTHEILERKTGGLVVWRSGSIIILYRGASYKYPYFLSAYNTTDDILSDKESSRSSDDCEVYGEQEDSSSHTVGVSSSVETISPSRLARSPLVLGVGSPKKVRFQLPSEKQLEEEADCLLDGLGPRFTDWWGYGPLPIDADLLPCFVPGYRRPFRLLPYGVNPKLTDREMTILRRLGRPLPCHFALGRNRNLQGLAASMVKLWEKCEVAKIAVKRGVQNTNSEMMAEELKGLTGGTLLSRDREFIVFYRGKDFLPPAVSAAIEERRKYRIHKEEQKIVKDISTDTGVEHELGPAESVCIDELEEMKDPKRDLAMEIRKLRSTSLAVKSMDVKLSMALEKKEKAKKLLAELEKVAEPQKPEVDREGISEEERYMLRKVGLRMKAFLLLGRRGVFDGTIENMHLHWKYRELVKIICKDRCIEDVHIVAQTLEAESGGILVAVERVNKGHAIIVYRGKNYQRPADLRPRTLLNKRLAMKRSLEAQRCESLKLHVLKLDSDINKMKLELAKNDQVVNFVQSTEGIRANTESDTGSHTRSLESGYHQENTEANEDPEVDASSLHSIERVDSSRDSEGNAKTSINVIESTFQVHNMQDMIEHSAAEVETYVSRDGSRELSLESSVYKPPSSVHKDKMEGSDVEIPFMTAPLSNRDRLVLRKQALKMKKRPVLAIGKSNAITGVAKAIKMHFQRNPLAIVNVKGRAKGTSVQEVVFELEQATGAVLVSQEPNKVILYRGWGEEHGVASKKEKKDERETRKSQETAVSPRLLAAVRIECGLQTSLGDVVPF